MKKIFMGFIILILCLCFINVVKADYYTICQDAENSSSCSGDITNCGYSNDEDWAETYYTKSSVGGYIYENFTIFNNSIVGGNWIFKSNYGTYTISCWNYSLSSWSLFRSGGSLTGNISIPSSCFLGNDLMIKTYLTDGSRYYEAKVCWNVSDTPPPPDITSPVFSNDDTNSTFINEDILHSLKIEDFDNGGGDKGLSGFIFSFDNGTGNFINDSWIPFNSNPDWSNITKTVGSIELTTIRWKVYANDTSGNTGSSDVFIYVLNGITNCITLNKSGRYYLINDIINSYATTCINIISNDIIFDCGGHTIDRTISLLESSVGIQVYRIGLNDTNITIKNCVITNWRSRGVRLYYSGRNNLTNLNISGAVTGAGVDLSNANNNFITNVKSSSNLEGTFIHASSNNIFSNNIFNDNSGEGIGLAVNSHDNIINNNIINSNGYGIYLYSSSTDNFIYNNLFNNTVNYYNKTNYFNYWNITQQEGSRIYSDGTNIGGNYWTNSSGNDYSDICLDVDKDGFCDNYYNLFSLNIDYLPLSNKYIEPIIPIWYISAPENGTIINEQYFDIEVGYNLTDYPTYEIGSLGIFLCNYDVEVCNYDNSFKQIYSEDEYFRTYIEDGTYFYFVELYIFETGNPENEFVFYTEIKSLTMNGSYEKLYIFYTEENIVNGSEINNNTLNLYWNYNGTLNIWEIIYTSIEIQKDLGEGYEIIDGIYFEGTETTSTEINFLNYTGDYRFVMYMEVIDNESNFYGFYEDTQTLYYTILGLPEEEPEIEEETIEQKLNIQNRFIFLITILLVFSLGIFLFEKFGKKGMFKLSIFLVMLFALSLKVLAISYDYTRENNLLNLVTIILILCFVFYIYQKVFKNK